jgi:hypothetical protein
MKLSRTILSAGALSALFALGMTGYTTAAHAAPELSIKSEEMSHPRMVRAIHEMREALKELREAPHDFGGHKEDAIKDTERAIHSLKRALYYRLKMDDAAIDRAQ